MTYQCDNGAWVVSAYQVWVPGAFETERAAKFVLRLSVDQQYALHRKVNLDEDRLITWDDVKSARTPARKPEKRPAERKRVKGDRGPAGVTDRVYPEPAPTASTD